MAMISPDPMCQLVVRVSAKLRQQMRLHCLSRETTLTEFITEAIVERLSAPRAGDATGARRPTRGAG